MKGKPLNEGMCVELQRFLKLEKELTEPNLQIGSLYHHYNWEIRVKNTKAFKRALAKYKESHPKIDIIVEDMNIWRPTAQYIVYLVGGLITVIRVFV